MDKARLGGVLKERYGITLRDLLGKARAPLLDDVERVNCNLCGSEASIQITEQDKYGLPVSAAICPQCGLVFLNPRPTAESYRRFYEKGGTEESAYHRKLSVANINLLLEEYFGKDFEPLSSDALDEDSADPLEDGTYDHYGMDVFNYLREHVPAGSRVFEIGASCGRLLIPWKAHHGCEVGGVEPKRQSVIEALQYHQIELLQGFSDNPDIPQNHYDLVMNIRTLDHMLNPLQELMAARNWLREGGYMFVDVQDTMSRVAYKGLSDKVEIDHAYIFSPATLKALLQKAGFFVERVERVDVSRIYAPDRTDEGGLWQLRALARKSGDAVAVEWPNPVAEAAGYLRNSQRYESALKKRSDRPQALKRALAQQKEANRALKKRLAAR